MSTFALDVSSDPADIITGLNYALANLGQGGTISSANNVLVANIATGEITTTTSNSGGYTSTTIVSYLYQYMDVKYANSATGGSGFSSNCFNRSYYGLRNTANTSISSNPTDYVWFQATNGFGTTKNLWYQTIGGRQVAFFAGAAAPQADFIAVPDNTPLNLDTVTSAQNNQIVNVNAYYQANTTPATPAGGTYNFTTFTLTPPTGWSATIPSFVANTSTYVSQSTFVGNSISTVGPATVWTAPAIYTSQFQGNTGAPGARGFVPLGYVVTPSNPTSASDATLTSWFTASRANASPPIGLGYAPISGDTAQFFFQDNFNPNNDVTLVKSFNGTTWTTVPAQVVSGGLIVPGTITANTLNANQIYAITVQSTNAEVGNIASPGYWLQANTGSARFGGDVNIGNNLKVGQNAQFGGNLNVTGLITQGNLGNAVVTSDNIQAAAITSVKIALDTVSGDQIKASTINGTNIAPNTITGNLITASTITGNLIAAQTIVGQNILAGTITGNLIAAQTITGDLIAANTITGNLITANTIQGSSIVAGSITANELSANAIVVGNITSTGTTLNDPTASGYWLNNSTGSVRFGGTTSIGNNLQVGQNATIGGNLTVTGLVTAGNLTSNTVSTINLTLQSVSSGNGVSSQTSQTISFPNNTSVYYYNNVRPTITTTVNNQNVYINGQTTMVVDFVSNLTISVNIYLMRSTPAGGNVQLGPPQFFVVRGVAGIQSYLQPSFSFFDTPLPTGTGTATYFYEAVFSGTSGTAVDFARWDSGTIVLQGLKR